MVRNAKHMQRKSRKHLVQPTGNPLQFRVVSGTSGETYWIRQFRSNILAFRCSCDFGRANKIEECSHIAAVRGWLAAAEGRRVEAWASQEQAKASHHRNEGRAGGLHYTTRRP